ncbi:uncharacterized protein LOC110179309 [Drosophila serrata]|uniref:uncharacterized protein LOC110179309 n=1 Tax=Drosophila serrata TaxID=7274 RepID=UPI000A1D1F17|nr:uncharacterized protein LOC110179309 [Drosophila serrata]
MPIAAGLSLLLCLLLISSCSQTAASTLWGVDQLGAYFSGIFRSVVGPLFGFGPTANNTASSF